jgi:uncharacterized protein (DUF1778 family)
MATLLKSSPTERLEARVPSPLKRLVQKAATLQGRSLTEFVIVSLEHCARQTLREHETMKLGREDSLRFVKLLLNPPKPNATLKRAIAHHRQTVRMK